MKAYVEGGKLYVEGGKLYALLMFESDDVPQTRCENVRGKNVCPSEI
jgi:hypothetical protein